MRSLFQSFYTLICNVIMLFCQYYGRVICLVFGRNISKSNRYGLQRFRIRLKRWNRCNFLLLHIILGLKQERKQSVGLFSLANAVPALGSQILYAYRAPSSASTGTG
jgi:hypothetical protein